MNAFTYENQGSNTYLVYKVAADENMDAFSLGMISNNKISGLASTVFLQIDNDKYIKYNVSAKVSVGQFFSGPVNKKRIIGVFNGIVEAMLSAEEYMIEQEMILLDLDYIFTDVSTCKTDLICLPIMEARRAEVNFRDFFKNIMFSAQFDQTENCDYVAKIMNYLNSTPSFSLVDFKDVLDIAEKGGVVVQQAPSSGPAVQSTGYSAPVAQSANPQPVVQQSLAQPSVQPQVTVPPQMQPAVQQPAQPPVQQQGFQRPDFGVVNVPNNAPQQAEPQKKGFSAFAKKKKSEEPAAQPDAGNEKPMSFMYLMQHYSSENAAAYKAQKEAKKQGAEAAAPAVNASKNDKKNKKQQIPNASGFAIPGQAAPPVGNVGFAVPGQAAAPVAPVQKPVTPIQPVAPVQSVRPAAPARPAVPAQPVTPVQPVAPAAQPVAPAPQPVTPIPQPAPVPQGGNAPFRPKPAVPNFGETTVLGGGQIGETTVLNATGFVEQKPSAFLIRVKNNERIPLDKPVFRIGKERSYVDYFIGDNTAISRSHANIINRDGEFFIVDTNSTNHTYVNGQMIPSNAEFALTHGAKVRLANEEFEFNMY